MYGVQNFLSATSIFVEKFLLNIFAAAEGILCQKFVNSNRFKLYHQKLFFEKLKHSENTSIVLFEEMQTWNCIWELAEEGKIKEKVKYRGTHPCFRDCCKNPSDENRATAKIPKKSCKWNRESASAPLTFESKGDGWQPQKNDDVTFSLQNSDFEGDFKTSENGNLNNSIFWFCQICAHICSPLWYLDWNSSMHKHWGKVGGQLGKSRTWKPRCKFTVFDQTWNFVAMIWKP